MSIAADVQKKTSRWPGWRQDMDSAEIRRARTMAICSLSAAAFHVHFNLSKCPCSEHKRFVLAFAAIGAAFVRFSAPSGFICINEIDVLGSC